MGLCVNTLFDCQLKVEKISTQKSNFFVYFLLYFVYFFVNRLDICRYNYALTFSYSLACTHVIVCKISCTPIGVF